MAAKKNHTLPNQELINEACENFNNFSDKWLELNKLYLAQLKSFLQGGINSAQQLYTVNTPEEFVQEFTRILNESGALYLEAFLADMNALLAFYTDICKSSAHGADSSQTNVLKFFDFYSKLLPNPLAYKLDDIVKNMATGNHDAAVALQKIVDQVSQKLGAASTAGQASKKNPKSK